MNYYSYNIDKYRAATAHLTNEEDLCYRRLLDHAYDIECPINTTGLARKLRVSPEVLKTILEEFFEEDVHGEWEHPVVKRELQAIYEKSEKARTSAKARWSHSEPDANALPPQSERNANGMLHKTEDITHKTDKKSKSVSQPTDAQFWQDMSVKYPHINMDSEQNKMTAWISVNPQRKLTRKFVVNWLNRIEVPLTTVTTDKKYEW